MALINLTSGANIFSLDENNIVRAYQSGETVRVDYVELEHVRKKIFVSESMATIADGAKSLMQVTDTVIGVVLINSDFIVSVHAQGSGALIRYDAGDALRRFSVTQSKSEVEALFPTPPVAPYLVYTALLTQEGEGITELTSGELEIGKRYAITDYVGGVANDFDTLVAGTGYTSETGEDTTGGTGLGLTVDFTAVAGVITVLSIAAGGEGYTIGDVITVAGGTGGTFVLTEVLSDDFSNVANVVSGTINETGCEFIATGTTPTTPTTWTEGSVLTDTSAPVATILENTLGEIPIWGYLGSGNYKITTVNNFFIEKKWSVIQGAGNESSLVSIWVWRNNENALTFEIYNLGNIGSVGDFQGLNMENNKTTDQFIEIRVYP